MLTLDSPVVRTLLPGLELNNIVIFLCKPLTMKVAAILK